MNNTQKQKRKFMNRLLKIIHKHDPGFYYKTSKLRKMKYIFFLITGGIILSYFVFNSQTQNTEQPKLTISERVSGKELSILREEWSKIITEEGSKKAYSIFLIQAQKNTAVDTHTQAHIFGEALYKAEGIDGVKTCDSSFEFGCYHSFFGSAISSEGVEALSLFDKACEDTYGKKNLPCQHGIGHGTLAYTGYDDLNGALELCETISWQSTGGCSSGVFMEYNFRTLETVDNNDYIRSLEDDVYAPCSELPEKYQPSCYNEQVQWWQSIYGGDFYKIGLICSNLPIGSENYQACFHGIGNYIAAQVGLDSDKVIQQCSLMPSTYSQSLCYEGASWLIRGDGSGIESARRVCEALIGEVKTTCLGKL